jgi:hypothetical protein
LIIVLDADDIILVEIAPGLPLDQFQLALAGAPNLGGPDATCSARTTGEHLLPGCSRICSVHFGRTGGRLFIRLSRWCWRPFLLLGHDLLESALKSRHDVNGIWRTEFVSVQLFPVKPAMSISDATKQPRHPCGAGMLVIFYEKNGFDARYGRSDCAFAKARGSTSRPCRS